MIISNSPCNIVATLLAKNEEDIIGANIEHHINHGIKQIIVTDNGSTDNTKSICAKYPEVVEIIDEPGECHEQSAWVTKMARMACKLNPDWIIHLDADELWEGFYSLRSFDAKVVGSTSLFLHPPVSANFSIVEMRYYLDFNHIDIPGECKIAHRPDPELVITHGNHGVTNSARIHYTKNVCRHHYPVRSINQFISKAVNGHLALKRRNAICERWEKWYNLHQQGKLASLFESVCQHWQNMIANPNLQDLLKMMEFWSTPETMEFFQVQQVLPIIRTWPKVQL
jgi:glycosyltransferase involved in cell wall biosynthesis